MLRIGSVIAFGKADDEAWHWRIFWAVPAMLNDILTGEVAFIVF